MTTHRPIQALRHHPEPSTRMTLYTVCPFCDQSTEIDVETNDFMDFRFATKSAQACFPYLTDDQREMLISGTCPRCFPTEPDEENEMSANPTFTRQPYQDKQWVIESLLNMGSHPDGDVQYLIDMDDAGVFYQYEQYMAATWPEIENPYAENRDAEIERINKGDDPYVEEN